MPKLDLQNPSLNGIQPAIEPFHFMEVFLALTVIAQHPNFFGQIRVVRGHGTAFAARAKILSRVEAECGGAAHGPGLLPASVLPGKVFRAMCLARVLDDAEIVGFSQLKNGVQLGGLAV